MWRQGDGTSNSFTRSVDLRQRFGAAHSGKVRSKGLLDLLLKKVVWNDATREKRWSKPQAADETEEGWGRGHRNVP